MELVVVERKFDEPQTYDELDAMEKHSASCFRLHQVRHVQSFFSRDRKRLICVYEGPDAEAVRQANRKAGLPYENVWTADAFPAAEKHP